MKVISTYRLEQVRVLAICPRYAGESCAAVVTASERPGERPAFQVDWIESHDFAKTARRCRDVTVAKTPKGDDLFPDLTVLADVTAVGQPGLDSLAATIGFHPNPVFVTGTSTREPTEHDPREHLSPADLVGVLQSAVAFKRLRLPAGAERDELLNELAALEADGETLKGHDAPHVRAVGLGIWWCARALGDSFSADLPPSDDPREADLRASAEAKQGMAESLGLTGMEFDE